MVEYVYNNTKYESMGMILFEAEYGHNPDMYRPRKENKADNE